MHPRDRGERRSRRERADEDRRRHPPKPRKATRPPDGFGELLRIELETVGFALVELDLRGTTIEVTAELATASGPTSGISIEDCTRITRLIHELLESKDVDPEQLDVIVASPGLDRRLHTGADLTRFAGSQIAMRLHEARDGRRNWKGELLGGDDEMVRFRTDQGPELEVALSDVAEIRLVPQF